MIVLISGLNLEKLLREAQQNAIALRSVRRVSARCVQARVSPRQLRALVAREIRRRWSLALGMVLCIVLVSVSSKLVLRVDIQGAQEYSAEVRRFLCEEGPAIGALKHRLSFDGKQPFQSVSIVNEHISGR